MSKRKKFSSETKIQILQKHLQKKKPISELCAEYECTPGSVYQWQETLFGRGHQCFETKPGRPANELKREQSNKALEEKVAKKNEVISELMEELLKEKKQNGAI